MQIRSVLLIIFCLANYVALAQDVFVPNDGQWDANVLFRTNIKSGQAFLKENGVRYAFYNSTEAEAIHHLHDSLSTQEMQLSEEQSRVHCYAYDVNFLNANSETQAGFNQQKGTASFFLGKDQSKWIGALPTFGGVHYSELYNGIDLKFYNRTSTLKYDFILRSGADPAQIQMQYVGQHSLQLKNGALVIDAGFISVREIIPEAYQVVNGRKNIVRCNYEISNDIVRFHFPDGYNSAYELVIDPEVIASTHSGSTAMAFGFTSTYDEQGNIYVGGVVYAQGYPVSVGAYDVTYDSINDIAITKFNPNGSAIIYSTYIGGNKEDYPMSLYVHNGNLYVYGCTYSSDFPTTPGAFDPNYHNQRDIIIFCLNANASALIGSTYVGGTGDDGANYITTGLGDGYKGEIVVDQYGDVYVASGSASANFPATPGAYCTTVAGGVDAVIFRMNATLTTMVWATFLGASLHDYAMGIRVDKSGNVYACGTTRGVFGPLPSTPGTYQSTYGGGATDAYIAKFDPTGSTLLACTYFGGTGQDVGSFIDIDIDGDVYLTGLCPQGAPVTSGVYSVPGSINFIAKLNSSLSTLYFSTLIGDGTTTNKLIPSAFMVDKCKRIFLGGFEASQNWPLTSDALYTTWGQHTQWYLTALDVDASSLLFGSFYGSWHCDGGTSRFDPNGVVYQAVCADSVEFPVTSWAYADGTNTHMWDICVFKIDFQIEKDSANLPNVFTPNGDGINDVYDEGLVSANFFELKIFDRWGVEVFTTNNLNEHWDGTYRKNECEEGVYYVECKHGYCAEEPFVTTGFVHLIRGK